MFYAVLMSGAGDGSGGNASSYPVALLYYVPSLYLLSLFVCCFIRSSALNTAAIFAYALLAFSLLIVFLMGRIGIIVFGLPLIGFAFTAHRLVFTNKKHAD